MSFHDHHALVNCNNHLFLDAIAAGTPYTNQERLSPETIEMLNKQVGLDKPVIVQYGIYLSNLLQGDFGISFQFKTSQSHIC